MEKHGYQDTHVVYVYKPQQNTTGLQWIFAVEMLVNRLLATRAGSAIAR